MKILVTGGAGFIGGNLVPLLVEKGAEVCVLDSLISGKRERVPEGVTLIKGDIRDSEVLRSAMNGVTHVVHLAALVSVPESMKDPVPTCDVNVAGTESVLSAAREAGVKRFVYATSAAVYGDEPSLPKKETSELRPQSPYALSKVMNELQAEMYGRAFGLSAAGLRFFNVYGPGQEGHHPYATVIPRWIEAIKNERPITIYGDGFQTRDFIHVSDVVGAIYGALTSDKTGVYNIASGEETSLNNLVDIIECVHGKPIQVNKEPARGGDIIRSVADISAARSALGFTPAVALEKGIKELLTI